MLQKGVAWTLPILFDRYVETAGGVVLGDGVGLIIMYETPMGVLNLEDV